METETESRLLLFAEADKHSWCVFKNEVKFNGRKIETLETGS